MEGGHAGGKTGGAGPGAGPSGLAQHTARYSLPAPHEAPPSDGASMHDTSGELALLYQYRIQIRRVTDDPGMQGRSGSFAEAQRAGGGELP